VSDALSTVEDALFVPDGDLFVPTVHTRGPWDPRAQHGGAPAALMVRCIEQVEAPLPMEVARITVELMRPVPVSEPLRVQTRIVRPGKKVQLVEAVLALRDGGEVCRALALRIRSETFDIPAVGAVEVEPPPPPQAGRNDASFVEGDSFVNTAVEMRFVRGRFVHPGPATVWIRLRMPVVPGEAPSGAQRACAAADFGNGVSAVYDWGRTLFINPDLTVHLGRTPVAEWICLEAVTHPGTRGRALAESRLFDVEGLVGRSLQSLLVEPLQP
jgi:Thioesterase-like superfamily